MNAKKLLLRLFELVAPARRLQVFNGDSLPRGCRSEPSCWRVMTAKTGV